MGQIRKATNDDLEQVRTWLQQEANDGHHSFICNFNLIEEGQRNGWLTVLVEDIPIAFALGDDNLAIFAVKVDRRRGGIGTKLALHWFQEARDRDLMGFYGECAPKTSLRFWKKMGCQEVESPLFSREAPWVALLLRKKREMPEGVPTVPLTFEIKSPDGTLLPEWSFSTEAAVIEPDDYMLAEDFVAYVPRTDSRLTIRENGKLLCESRVGDVENVGGTRTCPWVRVRDLSPQ